MSSSPRTCSPSRSRRWLPKVPLSAAPPAGLSGPGTPSRVARCPAKSEGPSTSRAPPEVAFPVAEIRAAVALGCSLAWEAGTRPVVR